MSGESWASFLAGIALGFCLGMFTLALCVMAKRGEEDQ